MLVEHPLRRPTVFEVLKTAHEMSGTRPEVDYVSLGYDPSLTLAHSKITADAIRIAINTLEVHVQGQYARLYRIELRQFDEVTSSARLAYAGNPAATKRTRYSRLSEGVIVSSAATCPSADATLYFWSISNQIAAHW